MRYDPVYERLDNAYQQLLFRRPALLGGLVPLALAGCDPNPNNCNGAGLNTASGALIGAAAGAALGDGNHNRYRGSIDNGTGAARLLLRAARLPALLLRWRRLRRAL